MDRNILVNSSTSLKGVERKVIDLLALSLSVMLNTSTAVATLGMRRLTFVFGTVVHDDTHDDVPDC